MPLDGSNADTIWQDYVRRLEAETEYKNCFDISISPGNIVTDQKSSAKFGKQTAASQMKHILKLINLAKRKKSGQDPDPSESRPTETNDVPNSSPVDGLGFRFSQLLISNEARNIPIPLPRIRSKGRAVVISDSPPSPRVSAVIPRSPPPEDFRNMTIIPKFEELIDRREPYLRPNVVEGGYESVDHYLDVHFRLLREDFVRPLREGIRRYREGSTGSSEVRLYRGVHIVGSQRQRDGVIHKVLFHPGSMKMAEWEASKRLAFGSLVCLSRDEFRTALMATVAESKPWELAKGVVHVRFDDCQRSKFHRRETFVMLENTAFFEAYKHVLACLMAADSGGFPFREAIVFCDRARNPPKYLGDPGARSFVLLKTEDAKLSESIDVLNGHSWPTASSLGLDESQRKALHHCLTSELAIVQGPPGTGKTFLGLKVMETLLANWHRWNKGGSPILVVCYTNHALDQFLEGILKFLKTGVIRVGGRSQCPALDRFNLKKLRELSRMKRNGIRNVMKEMDRLRRKLRKLKATIEGEEVKVKDPHSGLVDEKSLKCIMTIRHYSGLTSVKCQFFGSHILNWLHVNSRCAVDPDLDEVRLTDLQWRVVEEFFDVENEEEFDRRAKSVEKSFLRQNSQNGSRKSRGQKVPVPVNPGEWHAQKELIKDIKSEIKRNMENCKPMDEEECSRVKDPWRLPVRERWRMYGHWLEKYKTHLLESISDGLRRHEELTETLKSLCLSEDERILRQAKVIGMTTTGAARNRELLSILRPKVIVVEEAAEVLESHIVASLNPGCQHLVLIGDHEQLRPSAQVHELETEYLLNCSLFERLVKNGHPFVSLERQHRMRPEISCFARITYGFLRDAESVLGIDFVKGVAHNVFFVNHDRPESQNFKLVSSYNTHEASFLARLCRYLIQQGYSGKQITILSPYKAQTGVIQNCLQRLCLSEVQVCPIDGYQGEENDIVLLSLVRSNHSGKIGFLKESNRLNVAMTRAKRGLYIVGNFDMLKTRSEFVRKIYDLATKRESQVLGPKLPLRCQNHPGVVISVSTAEDFDLVPEGGCSEQCNFSLPCGHHCPRACHPDDRDHMNSRCEVISRMIVLKCGHEQKVKCWEEQNAKECKVIVTKTFPCGHSNQLLCHEADDPKVSCRVSCSREFNCGHHCAGTCGSCRPGRSHPACQQACLKILPCGHPCNKTCSEKCGGCEVLVSKKIPECSHWQETQCGLRTDWSLCREQCPHILPCGHPCLEPCGSGHTEKCPAVVKKSLPCGHEVDVRCHSSGDDRRVLTCTSECGRTLECGHACEGACRECRATGRHLLCYRRCENFLPCGHGCLRLCHEECRDCERIFKKTIPGCWHVQEVPCGILPAGFPCRQRCFVVFPCGHAGFKECSEEDSERCKLCSSGDSEAPGS